MLEAEDYRVYYKTLSGYIRAVDGVHIKVYSGLIVGIIGESGCGKSTLAQSIVYPKYPMFYAGGKLVFDEKYNLTEIPLNERKKLLLTHLAYIPQYALDALPVIKKIGNFIADIAKDKGVSKEELLSLFKERLKQVNLPMKVLDMYPIELSGGMRQRVVIAITTLLKPKLLIADEPTSALDVVTQRQVLELLRDLRDQKLVESLVMISHDVASIRQIADYIATMYAGKIVEIGPVEDTIKDPLHPYTSLLIKAIPPIGASYKTERLRGLSGSPPSLLNPPPGCRFHPRCPHAFSRCKQEEPPLVKVGNSTVACWLYTKG
ncbi:MAG: ABC transporter ATP-binding protein [Desulfurococcaceae archaeon]